MKIGADEHANGTARHDYVSRDVREVAKCEKYYTSRYGHMSNTDSSSKVEFAGARPVRQRRAEGSTPLTTGMQVQCVERNDIADNLRASLMGTQDDKSIIRVAGIDAV